MRLLYCFLVLNLFFSHSALSQENIYKAATIDPSLLQNANAVVRLDRLVVEVKDVDDMYIESERVVTILNKKGNGAMNSYLFYDEDIHIKDMEIRIYDAGGNEIEKIKEKDFKDRSAVANGTLYSDSRFKYFEYKPHHYPYTFRFSYAIKTENTASIPSFSFMKAYNLGVEKSEYILKYNKKEFNISLLEENFGNHGIEKKESPTGTTFTATNLAAVEYEILGPALRNRVPRVLAMAQNFNISGYLGSVSNWEDFGKWMYHEILKGRAQLPESTVQKMQHLVEGVSDPLEKAKIIYKYVQENTRYISVQVGIGGIQPIPAMQVDKVKYGDCKGLTNYTMALLQSVGVPSYYTHVEAGRQKVDLKEDFASLAQGNHVILAIPHKEKLYWIDCTSSTSPFGFLGDFTDDRKALMITPKGGKIVTTPSYLNEKNYQKVVADIFLDQLGNMTCEMNILTRGIQYDNRHPITNLSAEDLLKRDINFWDNIDNLTVKNHQFENNKAKSELTETLQLSAPGFASKYGERLIFLVNPINKMQYVPLRYKERKSSFFISRGFLDEDEITIHIPQGYELEAFPKNVDLETPFGNYKSAFRKIDKNTLVYTKYILIKAGEYRKEDYKAYRDFREQIASRENAKISLLKSI